jgi:predicted enzyme related to lactoylglutathione lyase
MDTYKTHGAFSWQELMTGDAKAAVAFYGELFGWTVEDMDMGPAGTYHVIKVDGTSLGGIMAKPPGQESMPTAWSGYVTVNNVDETAARCAALGGTVCVQPMDIPTVGRFAVIQDPQGAVLNVITYSAS